MLRVKTVLNGVQGSPWLSTMFFTGAVEDQAAANAAVTAVGAFWTSVKAFQNNQVSFATQPQVDVMLPAGEHTGAYATTPVTGTGAASQTILPPALNALCQWRTGTYVNSREVRGRTFIPGLTINQLGTNGSLTTSFIASMQTIVNALISASGPDFAVWDRTHAGIVPVTTGTPWASWAVLRSRRD